MFLKGTTRTGVSNCRIMLRLCATEALKHMTGLIHQALPNSVTYQTAWPVEPFRNSNVLLCIFH